MAGLLPDYYSSLSPFRSIFAEGCPALMYHKLGPRPGGTKHKGLYVSGPLFSRQMGELASAGYRTATFAEAIGGMETRHRFVLTFDDGFSNVLANGLEAMSRSGFSAIQYLVADRLGQTNDWETREGEVQERLMDAAQVRDWLAAGHKIGAHTLTHPWLTRISPADAHNEIRSSRRKLEDLFGVEVADFCYPYGDWNPAIGEAVEKAGYKTACTTRRGVNTSATPPLELRRFMARYPSRHWRQWWIRFRLTMGSRHSSK